MSGELHSPEYRIIDVHVHDPELYSSIKSPPELIARKLMTEMDELSIEKIFLYSIEITPKESVELITYNDVYKAVEETTSAGVYRVPRYILSFIEEYDNAINEHVSAIRNIYTPLSRVLEISRHSSNRILAVANLNVRLSVEDLLRSLESVVRGIVAVKIFPTFNLMYPNNKRLFPLYSYLEKKNIPVFIHTGCDPGFWELPYFCRYGDPAHLEDVVAHFPKLKIILCHMGSYSALKPGIFMHSALRLLNRYDNVYGDTSAVNKEVLERIVSVIDPGKVLFGSDYPAVAYATWRSLIEEVMKLNVSDEVKERIFYKNAKEIFKV